MATKCFSRLQRIPYQLTDPSYDMITRREGGMSVFGFRTAVLCVCCCMTDPARAVLRFVLSLSLLVRGEQISFMSSPGQVRTLKRQRARFFGGAGCIVDTITTVEDRIPLSDNFHVEDRRDSLFYFFIFFVLRAHIDCSVLLFVRTECRMRCKR